MDDEIIDLAEKIGLRQAGDHLQKFGRYPTEDDTDDSGSKAWEAAWVELQRQGADDGLYDGCFTAWCGGFLGTRNMR